MTAVTESYHLDLAKGSAAKAALVLSNRQSLLILNKAFAAAGAATATVTSQVKTVNSVTFKTDGAWRTAKGATDNFWTLTGAVVPAASFTKYLLCVSSAGAASVVQSSVASTAAGCVWSVVPDGVSIFSTVTVATDATHTFTPGTTLLGAAGITTTYIDGFDPALLPIVADATSGAQVLDANGGFGGFMLG